MTRAAYHYAVRYVRRRETAIVQENFAKRLIGNHNHDLWSKVSKVKGSAKHVSNTVDGVTDSNVVADMFADNTMTYKLLCLMIVLRWML